MASTISAQQARAIFQSKLVGVYNDMLQTTSFLRSYFPSVKALTRYVSIQVRRDLELMSVDVMRHSEGTVNQFGKSTEKVIDPPFYKELLFLTDMDGYNVVFGTDVIDTGFFSAFMAQVAENLMALRNKIERAIEKQCKDVLETGVITLVSGDSIDYRRKAGSLVANAAGNTFLTNTVDPFAVLGLGGKFLREVGKSTETTFDILFGETAYAHMCGNTLYKERVTQNLNNNIDSVRPPQRGATGFSFHGQLTIGSFRGNIYTYPQSYDTQSGGTVTANPYINPKKVIMVPGDAQFLTAFAAVPVVADNGNPSLVKAGGNVPDQFYHIDEYIDRKHKTHQMSVEAAPVVIPKSVDKIYTVQVVA